MTPKSPIVEKRAGSRRSISFAALLAGALIMLFSVSIVVADYVGTGQTIISVDPASDAEIADGLAIGDQISFILQQEAIEIDANKPLGMNAYGTVYVPDGVRVVGAELVEFIGGVYVAIPAEDVTNGQDGCGTRGCRFGSTEAPSAGDGKINEVQSDTGIFYSTDSQTRLLVTKKTASPTGSDNTPIDVWNDWDYNQIQAFGIDNDDGNLSGNDGKGNTPVVPFGTANAIVGTGSPVAGQHTYYENDYDPSCNGGLGSNAFENDLNCVGPWDRIRYEIGGVKSKIGGSGPITADAAQGNTLTNNAVPTDLGVTLDGTLANALPAGTNAVRYVFGARTVGDLEQARITFEITNVTDFLASLDSEEFCLDGTGGDTYKLDDDAPYSPRGPQDNNWRYYESGNHACFTGGAFVGKVPTHRNGSTDIGEELTVGDIVGFEMSFTNLSGTTLYDVNFSDVAGSHILLVEEGSEVACPYPSYDGDIPGPAYTAASITSSSGATAAWDQIDTVADGETIKFHVCGIVTGNLPNDDGQTVSNQACAAYALTDNGAQITPPVCSNTLQIINGTPTAVSLASFSATGGSQVWPTGLSLALILAAALVYVIARKRAATA